MARKENEVNRYGERDVRPGHFQHGGGVGTLFQDQSSYGQVSLSGTGDWSHDPRSEAGREKHYGKGPKDWMNDDKIKHMACESLYHSSSVDASDIELEVKEGCIILRGSVSDRSQKRLAERAVETLPGVKDVRNELSFNRS